MQYFNIYLCLQHAARNLQVPVVYNIIMKIVSYYTYYNTRVKLIWVVRVFPLYGHSRTLGTTVILLTCTAVAAAAKSAFVYHQPSNLNLAKDATVRQRTMYPPQSYIIRCTVIGKYIYIGT